MKRADIILWFLVFLMIPFLYEAGRRNGISSQQQKAYDKGFNDALKSYIPATVTNTNSTFIYIPEAKNPMIDIESSNNTIPYWTNWLWGYIGGGITNLPDVFTESQTNAIIDIVTKLIYNSTNNVLIAKPFITTNDLKVYFNNLNRTSPPVEP